MTRSPRQPLDAEERALAARLPRPHGRDESGAGIDARILAAAHAAAASPLPATPRRRRWIVPAGLAASLCLAVGLAWRVQLAPPDAAPAAAPPMGQAPTAPVDTYPASPQTAITAPQVLPQPAPTVVPAPAPAPAPVPSRSLPAADTASMIDGMPPAPASAPPTGGIAPTPVTAFPALPAPPPPVEPAVAPRALATESVAAPAARTAPTPAPTPAPAPAMATKVRATPTAVLAQDAASDAPEADVPPATADAPEVREAWLRRIGQLQREGRTAEARASLAEFRRRYPDVVLPAELRALETPTTEPASQ